MYKVKRRANRRNTFARGWGLISPTPPQIAGFGGDLAGGGDAPGGAVHRIGEEEWEGGGGRGLRGPR